MALRYKPGDKVFVRADLELYKTYHMENHTYHAYVVQDMMQYAGQLVTIGDWDENESPYNREFYHVAEMNDRDIFWTDEMFECPPSEEDRECVPVSPESLDRLLEV